MALTTVAEPIDSLERMQQRMQQDDYVSASLLVATPGEEIYSAAGHAALRMECPSQGVDYCYEFDNLVDLTHILDYVNGNMVALYKRLYTHDFIDRYTQEGRGIESLRLNLRPMQEIALWQYLDYQTDSVGLRSFDFLSNNCASVVVEAVSHSIAPEQIVYRDVHERLCGTHREVFPYIFKNAPWAEFCWNIIMGTDFDTYYPMETRLFPVSILDEWKKATIRDAQGVERPLCADGAQTLLPAKVIDQPSAVTPTLLFALLLVLAIVVTVVEWRKGYGWWSRCIDVVLMTIETTLGLIIAFMLVFSHQVATSWNWLIIVFSPLPLLLWLLLRKRAIHRRLYFLYTLVLITYCVLTPLIPQMQYASMPLLLLAMAVRTGF
jgi:hypothetical protein